MPGMSGIELLQEIRNRPPKARIYVISGASDAQEQLEAGGVAHMTSGVLRKPFDMNKLLKIVGCELE
jgi:CheY-like chemotaxis protein